ncbi:AraC family transcriptional regulator [Paraglaciecola aquimarina]|uniref:AraC family transcriptional regulator n=1 Tax=Paraglaciecola aquimarina TaxID=1235557 RepID=A0ABU3SWI7_9ALTE|nr:AraC family transcriptional regulator [Paraglaciecola aquimarina]MDU0354369.1 AraC family transcriptional regulator [Paraglaciecola aquimarina]
MISIPLDTILYFIVPMITGQLLLLILIYFTVVRRRMIAEFPLHACFILSFVIYLLAGPLQFYSYHDTASLIIYSRFAILFSIGIPSMLIANLLRCRVTISRLSYVLPYFIGSVGATVYVVVRDGATDQILVSEKYGQILPTIISDASFRDVLILVTAILLVLPSIYLIARQVKNNARSQTTLLFLSSSLLLGLAFIVGEITNQFWLLNAGSFITVLCWCWAVYQDIQAMQIQACSLKEELQELIDSDEQNIQPDVIKLIDKLEVNQDCDIDDYKRKIKDLLILLTQSTIEQGRDNEQLLRNSSDKLKVIQLSDNSHDIKQLAKDEAIELSRLLANRPTKGNQELVDNAINYITKNYSRDIELIDIAQNCNVSDSYLSRIFKKVTGETPNQFITDYRIRQAKLILKQYSVNETSAAVGFKNPSYFSTVFKKVTGLSPLQYQKQFMKANTNP